MARKRKYEKVSNYWVYSIKVPSVNKYYIGVSRCKECSQRWIKSLYKDKSLEPYLNEWDSMIKTVLIDNLTKEEAYQYEDNIIQALKMNNLCINSNRSGLIADDINAYMKEYYENNTEFRECRKQQAKQYYEKNKEREKQQAKQWREDNREQYNEYQRQYQRQYYKRKKLEKQQHTSVH